MKKVYGSAPGRWTSADSMHANRRRGFGLCGIPELLLGAIKDSGVRV